MNILQQVQHALSGLVQNLPGHIKAFVLGEIAKVNIQAPDASKDDKANAVALTVASLLNIPVAFAHAIVHGLYVEAKASTPAIISPLLDAAEAAADSAIDAGAKALGSKIGSPFNAAPLK